MFEHYCELAAADDSDEQCGKIAHFKAGFDADFWLCVEHYDLWQATQGGIFGYMRCANSKRIWLCDDLVR